MGGSLFFGIDNDGSVKGLEDIQHMMEVISLKIRDYMDPLPDVEMIPLEQKGKHVLQLKVKEGFYTPYYYVGDGAAGLYGETRQRPEAYLQRDEGVGVV